MRIAGLQAERGDRFGVRERALGVHVPRVRDLVENAMGARGEIVQPVRNRDVEDAFGVALRDVDIRAAQCHVGGLVVGPRYEGWGQIAVQGAHLLNLHRDLPASAP